MFLTQAKQKEIYLKWYINKNTSFLDVIHGPILFKNVMDTGLLSLSSGKGLLFVFCVGSGVWRKELGLVTGPS
jgi:hypothetical protein